jgi:multidrug efflux pump subunit AcrA (membrane-fusion protein)
MYRAVFKNPNLRLVPGLFARVRIGLGEPASRLVVPESALGTDQRGDFLLLVGPDNIVEQRSVRLGILSGGSRVVEQGLSGEEWVIVKGLQRARPGVRVQPRPQGSPLAATTVSRSAG